MTNKNNRNVKSRKFLADDVNIEEIPIIERPQTKRFNDFMSIERKATVEKEENQTIQKIRDKETKKERNMLVNSTLNIYGQNKKYYYLQNIYRELDDTKFLPRDFQDLEYIIATGKAYRQETKKLKPLNDNETENSTEDMKIDKSMLENNSVFIVFDINKYREMKGYARKNKAREELIRVLDRWSSRKLLISKGENYYSENEKTETFTKSSSVVKEYTIDERNNIIKVELGFQFDEQNLLYRKTMQPIPEKAYHNDMSNTHKDGYTISSYIYNLYYMQQNDKKEKCKVKVSMKKLHEKCLVIPKIEDAGKRMKELIKQPLINMFNAQKELKIILDYKLYQSNVEVKPEIAVDMDINDFMDLYIEFDIVPQTMRKRKENKK